MIRVLVADDSATVRKFLGSVFTAQADFEVVGQVGSADEALAAIDRLRPDVITLDVFMPGKSAAALVRELLATRPLPVVLVSDAPRDAAEVFDALAAGALDFVRKPSATDPAATSAMVELVRVLSRIKVRRRVTARVPVVTAGPATVRLVTVASSTGGPAALRDMLGVLPAELGVPMVIAQHLAEGFEDGLARWLGQITPLAVRVAKDGEAVAPGHVLLGPPGFDIRIVAPGRVTIRRAPARGYHPCADELFSSAAAAYGAGTLAVVLSGIGADGAKGAADVVAAGGQVMAQDRASSAVYGMPREVTREGLASVTGTPIELGRAIVRAVAAAGPRRSGT